MPQLEITIEDVIVRFINPCHRMGNPYGDGEGEWRRGSDIDGFREANPLEKALLWFVLSQEIKQRLDEMSDHTGWANVVYLREIPKPKPRVPGDKFILIKCTHYWSGDRYSGYWKMSRSRLSEKDHLSLEAAKAERLEAMKSLRPTRGYDTHYSYEIEVELDE